MEVMEVHATTNLVRTLAASRKNGWRVVGAALGRTGEAVRSSELALGGAPTILVLGNEGKGLRTLVKRECDVLVAIPGKLALELGAGGGGRGRRAPVDAADEPDGDGDGARDDDDPGEDGINDGPEESEWEPDQARLDDEDRQVRPRSASAAARAGGAARRGRDGAQGRDTVESLNVSVAGAILLHQLLVAAGGAPRGE